MPSVDFSLYLITDRHVVPPGRTLLGQVRAALEGGVRAVQLREKDLSAAELYPLARDLRTLTYEFGARLLINDRLDIALAVAADGVHLGGHSLPAAVVRALLGPKALIGLSTHHLAEIEGAATGADFVTFGPVFDTPSKRPYGPPLGIAALQAACAASPLPVFALGGIHPETLIDLTRAGCPRFAVISAILAATDPANATHSFLTCPAPH